MDRDYTAFVHLVGPGGLAAQRDTQPGAGSYPTTRWEPGETIVDRFVLDVSQVGRGRVRVGDRHVPAGDSGASARPGRRRPPVPGDAARLATIRLP